LPTSTARTSQRVSGVHVDHLLHMPCIEKGTMPGQKKKTLFGDDDDYLPENNINDDTLRVNESFAKRFEVCMSFL